MSRIETDVAWCAGFFDGEGHVSYRRTYPDKNTGHVSGMIMCSVPQNTENIEVLEFFQSVIGFGALKGPYPTAKGKTMHVISYGVKEVQELFIVLKPYLKSEKTLAFQHALAGYWTHDSKATPDDYARSIKRAKKKGCPECGEEWNGVVCTHCYYIA